MLPRFLNRYPWPTRALIRLARGEGEKALDRARRKRGPKPRLLVVLDLVTLAKRGRFPALLLSFFHGDKPLTADGFFGNIKSCRTTRGGAVW